MIGDMRETWEHAGVNRARSSAGYFVKIRGLVGVEYEEGDLILHPASEALWATAGFGLSARSIEGTPERRAEVIERIRAGLDFLGWKLVVDDDVYPRIGTGSLRAEREYTRGLAKPASMT